MVKDRQTDGQTDGRHRRKTVVVKLLLQLKIIMLYTMNDLVYNFPRRSPQKTQQI